MEPRGIRNNNPGNIRKSSDKWQGLAASQPDRDFFTFTSPTYGIRALARVLITYQDRHNLRTVRGIIDRWAPPVENNTAAYIQQVSNALGVSPDTPINLHEFDMLDPLVRAIIRHENGKQPYSSAQITKGLVLAGVEPNQASIVSTRTAKVAGVTAVATAASPVIQTLDTIANHGSTVERFLSIAPWALAIVALLGIGYFLYTRWDDRKKGLR